MPKSVFKKILAFWRYPMGDGEKAPLRVQFNPKVCLEFHGATLGQGI